MLFIQGGGAGTHDRFDRKLVYSLRGALGPDYEIRYPRIPDEGDPSYAAWKVVLEEEFATLRGGGILIGHSPGGRS
ncbi:MAG: hypothetical protein K6T51_10295 [Rubrobacteraceae bacterium]|nr:hypothetical protein [Rubrobacteraceae bacterium]